MQKSQKLEKKCFFKLKWQQIVGPEIDENEIDGRAQDRFYPLHMAEASFFSCAVRHVFDISH